MPRGASKPYPFSLRKRVILDAALEVFAEHGIAEASIEQVRERSGASVGSIYHHFESKEGLAGAVYFDCLVHYQERFLAACRRTTAARELIEAGVDQHLRWVTENQARARFLATAREALSLAHVSALREVNRDFFAGVREQLHDHVEAGRIRKLPLDVLEAIWIGPSQELGRHWLSGRHRTPLPDSADALASAAWNALKTDKEDR